MPEKDFFDAFLMQRYGIKYLILDELQEDKVMDTREEIVRKRKRRRKRLARRRRKIRQVLPIGTFVFVLLCTCLVFSQWIVQRSVSVIDTFDMDDALRPKIEVQLLTPNAYSRPETSLKQIKGIVIHYTGNPGSSAKGNRDYFESLKDTKVTKASSHFIVGLDGEIIQCVPTAEIAYASNNRNKDTISIEVCHPDESGKFTEQTYTSLVHLTAWLCNRAGLTSEDLIRHYDVTGKICPKYYVEHEDAWVKLKEDVMQKMQVLSYLDS